LASEPALRSPDPLDQERLLDAAYRSPLGLRNGFHPTYNANGVVAHQSAATEGQSTKCWKYVQVYRNGVVEYVRVYAPHGRDDGRQLLPYQSVEKEVLLFCSAALTMYDEAGVEPPVVIMVTLLRAAGMTVSNACLPALQPQQLGADPLGLPEVRMDNLEHAVPALARRLTPAFDVLWNAFGAPKWPNYEQWCGQQQP
jgi:hypothetical protein